jgi:6-phosphofructo-2-kinase/fructose-2,6-biphosphatase 2
MEMNRRRKPIVDFLFFSSFLHFFIIYFAPSLYNKTISISGDTSNLVNIPHVIAMVGLPARGKTYISKKLSRYLNWIGINTRVFNLGEYRRNVTQAYRNHDFFRPDNNVAMTIRTNCAKHALDDVINWLENRGGEVAVRIFAFKNLINEK